MKITAKTLYKTGSVCMIIMGAGHLILHFALNGDDPASAHINRQMDNFKLQIAGFGSSSLLDFMDGF